MGRGSRYPMSDYRRDKRIDAVVETLLRAGSLGTARAQAVMALTPPPVVAELTDRRARRRGPAPAEEKCHPDG